MTEMRLKFLHRLRVTKIFSFFIIFWVCEIVTNDRKFQRWKIQSPRGTGHFGKSTF